MSKSDENVTHAELHEVLRAYPDKEDMRLALEAAMAKLENKLLWGFMAIGLSAVVAGISLAIQIIGIAR